MRRDRPDLRERREAYVDLVVEEMIPAAAEQGIAEFGDVFCEEGVFTVEESRRILLATRERGMKLRIHADELVWTGGTELAVELGARSADHLGFVSEAGMEALASSSCVATLLPVATFYLRLGHYPPARALIEAGAPVALAGVVDEPHHDAAASRPRHDDALHVDALFGEAVQEHLALPVLRRLPDVAGLHAEAG